MRKLLIFIAWIISFGVYSQCVPNPIYQDSMPNVWPSTGFPNGMVGVSYCQSWDMKAPATLIEAALGDTAFVTVDTLGQSIYIGDWPVDSVVTIDIHDLPPGIIVDCSTPNCTYLGGEIGCANIYGIPTTAGTYSTDIVSNLYSHGVVSINVGGVPLTLPIEVNYFDITGQYDTINRYTITIVESSSTIDSCISAITEKENNLDIYNIIKQNHYLYFNIYSGNTNKFFLIITDLLGRKIYSNNLLINSGRNEYHINKYIENGIYIITLNNDISSFSKKIQIISSN